MSEASTSVNFQPVVTKRASEIIFEQIRDMIIRQELKPGDRLPSERHLMEMFQRSRPTVREALRMLERGGYIRTVPGSNGAIIQSPDNHIIQQSIEDAFQVSQIKLKEMFEYRRVSEAQTVTWACQRRTDEDLKILRSHLDRMAACIDNYVEYSKLDQEYHRLIAAAGKNTVSVLINQTLSNINQNFMRRTGASLNKADQIKMYQKVHRMHEAIYDGIVRKDEELARKAMDDHLVAFAIDLDD